MKVNRLSKLSLAIGLSIATSSAVATPKSFMSARSFAMGGTGVAVATPSAAPSSNPAMMALEQREWTSDLGLMIPSLHARYADEEEVINQIDDIQHSINNFDEEFPALNSLGDIQNSPKLQQTSRTLQNQLIDLNKDNMRINAGAGISFATPSKAFSIGAFSSATTTITARGYLSPNDQKVLKALATGDISGLGDEDIKGTLAYELKNAISRDGTYNFDSYGEGLASAVLEGGLSFATSFELNNFNTLSVGVSPKYVQLRTYHYVQGVKDFDEDDSSLSDYETTKGGFNLDLGAAYSFGETNQWTTGVSVKNVIPMDLDSSPYLGNISKDMSIEKRTLELNPMVTAGIAHKSDYHVVTAELDLTKKEAFGYEDDTQWLALGAEFDAWRYAQLRAGVRHNLASNDDNAGIEEKTQFTAGLGLNILGARLDIGALYSSADVGAAIELGTAF